MPPRKQVIILDDDASILGSVERVLRANGFVVESYSTVEAFRTNAHLDEASCLILDINLDGACGMELKRQLTRSGVSLPVIFMTGDDKEATRQSAMEAGCVAYLHKPFAARALMNAVAKTV